MTWLISAGFTVPAWADSIPICSYEVVRSYPHDPRAFTQGLLFKDGFLFESTGLRGQSSVRKVRLESGEVLQKTELGGAVFGEGLAAWQGSLIQLTWTTGIGFILSAADLEIQRTFRYRGEGWGLTQSDQALLMSDGSAQIRVLDPIELKELHRINVTAGGAPVTQLNELEWVDGEIYANIWHSDRIARIDPKTGHVKSWIDLTGLLQGFSAGAGAGAGVGVGGEAVLNGIAYDSQRERLLVTGKLWPRLFEIKLTGPAACQMGKHRP